MSALHRLYPHEKTLVLNALYDALDVMGMSIIRANSARGILLISPEASVDEQLRIELTPDARDRNTGVEIITANDCSEDNAWANALLDEIASTIERAETEI